jgi:hypothetical protein
MLPRTAYARTYTTRTGVIFSDLAGLPTSAEIRHMALEDPEYHRRNLIALQVTQKTLLDGARRSGTAIQIEKYLKRWKYMIHAVSEFDLHVEREERYAARG